MSGESAEGAEGHRRGQAPKEARSEHIDRSDRTERSERSDGSDTGPHAGREVVIPMPTHDDLHTAHTDPPVAHVTLAARQLDPSWQQKVGPSLNKRRKHVFAVWELAVEAQGVQGQLRIPFPRPILVKGGSSCRRGKS